MKKAIDLAPWFVAGAVGGMVAATGCGPTTPVPPDAPPSSSSGADCSALCAQARAIGPCPGFGPTPTLHETCESWCARVAKFDHWDMICKSNAKTCGAIDACPDLP